MKNQQQSNGGGGGTVLSSSVSSTDLAAIRRLLDADHSPGICPSCDMPFDKGKKRRLIDNCGHERCYACMFTNESCPVCFNNMESGITADVALRHESNQQPPQLMGCVGLRGSEITLYGETPVLQIDKTDKTQPRSKVKTNGYFTTYKQHREEATTEEGHPNNLPKTRPSHQKCRSEPPGAHNQRCSTPPQTRRRFFLSPRVLRVPFGQRASKAASVEPNAASDEDGPSKPVKSNDNDMYMRLGLLLGDNARCSKRIQQTKNMDHNKNHAESCSSLASFETAAMLSSNTSPVSTLTGSSEDQQHMINPSSESVVSLMSMSMSGQSNCSSSSPASRRHSVTTTQPGPVEDLVVFRTRRAGIQRSARIATLKGPLDPKIRFAQYRVPQLTLKPLFFEVPLQEPDPIFIGRQWLIREIDDIVNSPSAGVVLSGGTGTGKTAFVLQLVEFSCFGRKRDPQQTTGATTTYDTIYCQQESIKMLAHNVVAYHFCQADNNSTCLVPDFVHSLAAQLCQAPQLASYRDLLLGEHHLQAALSLKECIANPDQALIRGILEPLCTLRRTGKLKGSNMIILIDALCEAEFHRPDHGDTITSFLIKHTSAFPSWLKIVATVRSGMEDIANQLNFARISLDCNAEPIQKDLSTYINFRIKNSPTIKSNISPMTSASTGSLTIQHKFCQHLQTVSKQSFLFAKLTLDLLERGSLVAKSSSYKIMPQTQAQIYLFHFNLRFPTTKAFEKVTHILSVCLAALYPLTLLEIYYSVNSLLVDSYLAWPEFLQRFKLLSGFLVKRLDNTYMFFHPSFRDWLIRRDDGENTKFLCDLRTGHAAIAFRLSRVQAPLDAEKTLELGHHILKAHIYHNLAMDLIPSRDLHALWVLESASNISDAICTLRNMYSPNVKVSRLLLLGGASPNHSTEFLGNAPALCMYANEGIVPMVSLLLEFGADVERCNSQGCTALSMASARGHTDVVRQLVAAGASPGRIDTSGFCSLVHAARNGCFSVVSYLLACDWLPSSARDVDLMEAAQQALVAAASNGNVDIVEYLLDMAEVQVDVPDTITGETALTAAAASGHVAVCVTLLNRGASICVCNIKGMPPLHLAVREGHWATTERLLVHSHAPIEQSDHLGRSALMVAAGEGHTGLTELLLSKGANVNAEDREGMSALSWSCLRGKVQAAQILVERGANLNQTDKTGRTPLDLAAFHGSTAMVNFLVERGSLIEHVDINGMRPLDRAIGCRNIQVVQCFLRKGAKLGPATWAMATGKHDILLILLNKLLEDGNVLYRKSRLKEAAHRYQYALKKLPADNDMTAEHSKAFRQLHINFLLNYSRCKRKLNEPNEAVQLADEVLLLNPDAYEAYYARAKGNLDLQKTDSALEDIKEAIRLAPIQSTDARKVLMQLHDEIAAKSHHHHHHQQQQQHHRRTASATSLTTKHLTAVSVDILHD